MLGDTEDVHGPGLDVVLAGTGRGNKLAPPASDAAGSARCQSFRQPARIAWAPGELRSRRRTGKGSKGGRLAASFTLLCTGMSRRKSARNYFTAERFAKVCETTKWNVRAALDLIFIHAEKEVRGRQPRASLNPFTVLAAVAAYERFFDHLYAAATDRAPAVHCFPTASGRTAQGRVGTRQCGKGNREGPYSRTGRHGASRAGVRTASPSAVDSAVNRRATARGGNRARPDQLLETLGVGELVRGQPHRLDAQDI
jgi:hypothetical protein